MKYKLSVRVFEITIEKLLISFVFVKNTLVQDIFRRDDVVTVSNAPFTTQLKQINKQTNKQIKMKFCQRSPHNRIRDVKKINPRKF